jgi:hypothetical protein
MMDHTAADQLMTTGWWIALLGGAIGAGLALMMGADSLAAGTIGLVTFGVFGVLLGKGGVELNVHSDHGPDHHAHDHHGGHH